MVRAPCCEKMGLKKGPWTPEEDQTLIAFIQRYGHGNWRALPKQAGLLRCGKSCRLRWTNYLRPDIKRGNFTKEEEEAIINLHEMLGNRWSAIAARLPGRTDNEIKNVWHTHLKKRLTRNQTTLESKIQAMETSNCHISREQELKPVIFPSHSRFENSSGYVPVSPQQSSSDVSSSGTIDSSVVTSENPNSVVKDESNDDSSEKITEINDNSWSEARSSYNSSMPEDFLALSPFGFEEPAHSYGPNVDDGMDFWFNLFLKAGELPELPEI